MPYSKPLRNIGLQLTAIILSIPIASSLPIQAAESIQVPKTPIVPNFFLSQTIIPPPVTPSSPSPILPKPLDAPLQIPPSPTPSPNDSESVSERTILVTNIEFINNIIFSSKQLGEILVSLDKKSISIASIRDQELTLTQLLQIASQVSNLYSQEGYKTSGAIISIPQETEQQGKGIVKIKVIEGTLEQITVELLDSEGRGRLANYVRSRLGVKVNEPLNVDRLLESLQFLQLDPLIETISATLSPGSEQNKSILEIKYQAADSFSINIGTNNGSSPSIGTFQRGITIREGNLFGLGDSISIGYFNNDGSNQWDASYEIPINASNATLRFEYIGNDNVVVEPPFDDINLDGDDGDITSNYSSYELTFRQPIIRNIQNQTYQEFALGFSASLLQNQSLLFDQFPLSLTADSEGNSNVFAIRFSQDFTLQNSREVFAFRSQFSLGLGALGSTINDPIPGIGEIADSQFFDWRGQTQYVRLLAPDTLLVLQSYLQLSDSPLLPAEQFYLGGVNSVRGYRQSQILTDNGFFTSGEIRLPILRIPEWQGILQIIPFVDYGIGWNVNGINPDPNSLASVGLGLQWQQENFSARLDWGIPLVDVNGRNTTWQENGFYFTVQYTPF